MARRSTSSSRTLSHLPKVGEPTRMSTTTSSTAPRRQVTYLACDGGTSAKWIPRRTPAAETEVLACRRSSGCPTALTNAGSLNASRNRSEEHTSELQSRGHLVCRLLLEKKKESEHM